MKKNDLSRYLDSANLTDKQYRCMSLKLEYGLSVAEIARELKLHKKTVDQHITSAQAKMQSSGQYETIRNPEILEVEHTKVPFPSAVNDVTSDKSQDDECQAISTVYEGGAFFQISVNGSSGRAWLPRKIIDDIAGREVDRAKKEIFSQLGARFVWWSRALALVAALYVMWRSIANADINLYAVAALVFLSAVVWISSLKVGRYQTEVLEMAQNRVSDVIIAHIEKVVTSGLFLYSAEWNSIRPIVFKRDGYSCKYDPRHSDLQVDHIMPRFKFPERSLDPENLQVLCRKCNFRKGARFVPEGQGQLNL